MKYNKFMISFITVFILIFALWLNMLMNQYKFLKKGESLEKKGNTIWAIDYYGYAITCFTPLSPFIKKAEKKLLTIGENSYKTKHFYKSLFAYEILRASYFQVRNFYQPRKNLIKKLNNKIAKVKMEILKKDGKIKDYVKEHKKQLKILQFNPFPSFWVSFFMCFLFLGWVSSIVCVIYKGFEEKGVNKRFFFAGIFSYIILFILWLLVLYKH